MLHPDFSCIILGCGRSGTSLMAGLLRQSGFFHGDRLLTADASNPTGYFEDRTVEAINEALLARHLRKSVRFHVEKLILRRQPPAGARWLAPLHRPVVHTPRGWIARQMQERVAHHPFCYKDPRFCHTLAAWLPLFPDSTRYVVVFRDPVSTARSMLSRKAGRPYARRFSLTQDLALQLWSTAYRHALEVLPQSSRVAFVHYADLLHQNVPPQLHEVLSGVQLDWSIVNPSLNRSSTSSGVRVPAACRELYERLCRLADHSATQAA